MLSFCYEVLGGLRNLLEENLEAKTWLQVINCCGSATTTTACQVFVPFKSLSPLMPPPLILPPSSCNLKPPIVTVVSTSSLRQH